MDITNPQRAKVLVHALPYIQEYSGKIVVIKYGGNAMISAKLKDSVMRDIVLLSLIGVKVVLVHGGGPEITETLEKLGKQTQFVDGLRVTDAETADVVQMVLAGKINKTLVNLIGHKGGRAIGLSGIDGQMIQARVRDERLGYVGEITKVDVRPILDVIDKGYIPVVSTVGCDTQGHVYNINADTAAARIAGELGAESLIAMTDISGIHGQRLHPAGEPFHGAGSDCQTPAGACGSGRDECGYPQGLWPERCEDPPDAERGTAALPAEGGAGTGGGRRPHRPSADGESH